MEGQEYTFGGVRFVVTERRIPKVGEWFLTYAGGLEFAEYVWDTRLATTETILVHACAKEENDERE